MLRSQHVFLKASCIFVLRPRNHTLALSTCKLLLSVFALSLFSCSSSQCFSTDNFVWSLSEFLIISFAMHRVSSHVQQSSRREIRFPEHTKFSFRTRKKWEKRAWQAYVFHEKLPGRINFGLIFVNEGEKRSFSKAEIRRKEINCNH